MASPALAMFFSGPPTDMPTVALDSLAIWRQRRFPGGHPARIRRV